MTTTVIILLCTLLLIAYVFDLSASKTKIPAVILLLLLGFGMQQLSQLLHVHIPDLAPLLPILGTVGLILIVLEGSLELKLSIDKIPLIKKSFAGALFQLVILAIGLSVLFSNYSNAPFIDCLVSAIPLCIISSAIAIPSVQSQPAFNKEFVIYESSLSDILGVLFFNFVALNTSFGLASFGEFGLQMLIILILSFVATLALAILLRKINHHIKFAPIILLVILIYAVSKVYHLPGLVFILLFGLFLGNVEQLKQFVWMEKFNPDALQKEVHKFKELTGEGAFLVRALFFMLFGFLIQPQDILNVETLVWSTGIVAGIFTLRAIQLKLFSLPMMPLLFIAPRGLITVLLFLAIEPSRVVFPVNNSLIIQVVLLTALMMMPGLLMSKQGKH